MLKHLLKLRVRMVCTSLDIVISELVTEPLVELLQNLTKSDCIQLDKVQQLQQLLSHDPIRFLQLRYHCSIILLNEGIVLLS